MTTVSHRPTVDHSDRRPRDPAARLRGVPDPAGGHRAAVDAGARDRLPPHRHGGDVPQRARRRRGHPRLGLDRDEVWVTSKLNNAFHHPDDARKAFEQTLSSLGFDYVDLFLIHWPLPTLYDGDYVSTWKVLEEFQREGRARSIGVSNFQVAHLERLAARPRSRRRSTRSSCTRTCSTTRSAATARPRHRHRGVVADRAGRRAGRPRDHGDRRPARPHARAGGAALAHRARQHRVPQVHHALAHHRRTSSCSTSSSSRRNARSARWTGARRGAPARIPTRSPTFPTDLRRRVHRRGWCTSTS